MLHETKHIRYIGVGLCLALILIVDSWGQKNHFFLPFFPGIFLTYWTLHLLYHLFDGLPSGLHVFSFWFFVHFALVFWHSFYVIPPESFSCPHPSHHILFTQFPNYALMSSLLIRSFRVTPLMVLNIFISVVPIVLFVLDVSAIASEAYMRIGPTQVF